MYCVYTELCAAWIILVAQDLPTCAICSLIQMVPGLIKTNDSATTNSLFLLFFTP